MKKEAERSRTKVRVGSPARPLVGGKEGRLPRPLRPGRRKNHRTEETCLRAHLSLSDFKPPKLIDHFINFPCILFPTLNSELD